MTNNYANPLDSFRSHSYHFILTVANTTEAHRRMIDSSANGSTFLQAVNSTTLGNKVQLGGESAYLLIDTRRYSQFSISSFEMQHVYGTGNPENPSVPAALSKMTLIDTTGVSFFNFLIDIMRNKVQSTRASAFFMLSIIFTGHDDSSPQLTQTIATCFIPMILVNLSFGVTSSGSTYDIEFMEVEGNPGAGIPQMVDLGDIQAISTEKTTNTVGGMIQALEDRLNLRSLQFFQKYTNEALKQANDAQQKNFAGAGKLVQYMITVPSDWKNFAIDTAGKSENVEQVFLKKTGASVTPTSSQPSGQAQQKSSYHAFSGTTSIPDAIKIVLDSSREYLELASTDKRKSGTGFVHKTVISTTSDATTYIIHYDIYPYKMPKIDSSGKVVAGSTGKNQNLPNNQIKNLITYDYIFSGKNNHVMDFKINFSPASAVALDSDLDMGQSRLASNASTGQKPEQVKETGLNKTTDFSPLIRPGEPIFMPMKTKDQQTNFSGMSTEEFKKDDANRHIRAKQEHTSSIATLNFLGSLDADIVVRGNPNIIRKYADRNQRGGIPKHPAVIASPAVLQSLIGQDQGAAEQLFNGQLKGVIASEKAQYYDQFVKPRIEESTTSSGSDPLLNGGDVSSGPLFVKVNVYTPNVDFLTNQAQGPAFTNKFFYTGAYMVSYVITTFEGGTFKHNLKMIPYDIDGSFSNVNITSSQTESPKGVA